MTTTGDNRIYEALDRVMRVVALAVLRDRLPTGCDLVAYACVCAHRGLLDDQPALESLLKRDLRANLPDVTGDDLGPFVVTADDWPDIAARQAIVFATSRFDPRSWPLPAELVVVTMGRMESVTGVARRT